MCKRVQAWDRGGWRLILGIFLSCSPWYFFETVSLFELAAQLFQLGQLANEVEGSASPTLPTGLGFQSMLQQQLYLSCSDLDSGPHACTASFSLTGSSSQPRQKIYRNI